MTTVRHVDRLWNAKVWDRLLRELLSSRPESSARLEAELHSLVATAALAMIRLDELQQSHAPLFGRLLRTVLASQERDGGWRDPATTALCLRALLIGAGHGAAIDAGLRYLAQLQQDCGSWPREPLRRMSSDAYATALVLFYLGDRAELRDAARVGDAVAWLDRHPAEMDAETKRLWALASLRCRNAPRASACAPQRWPRRCA